MPSRARDISGQANALPCGVGSRAERGMQRLAGKVALVTGAGSGIGRAVALRLAAEGSRVCCVDISEGALAETRAAIEQAGGSAIAHVCDVGDEAEVRATVSACIAAFGRLDH